MRWLLMISLLFLPLQAAWAAKLTIESEQAEVRGKQQQAIFTGNVKLRRDVFELHCDRLESQYKNGFSELEHATASGNVKIVNGEVRGSSERALLDNEGGKVTLIGHAELEDATGVVRGERIIHNLVSGRSQVEGSAAQGSDERVRITIDTEKLPEGGHQP